MRMRREERKSGLSATTVFGLMAVGALAVIALAGVRWFTGEAFQVSPKSIQVQNNEGVPAVQIVAASGLIGEHVLFVDLDEAAARIDDQPGVDAARITCEWNGLARCTVVVQVSRALAVIQTSMGKRWIDKSGKVQQAEGDVPESLQLRAEGEADFEPGSTVEPSLVQALLELKELQPGVKQYGYSHQYGVTYADERGWRVRLGTAGRAGEMKDKLGLVRQLRDRLVADKTTPGVIDVRFVDAPYYITVDR